ncbi:MAG TPA: energy transducer TonB [Allosphingosinicella sp.]|nr:energy transducer TonB [Allosphingosinicella sp.]
MLPLLAFLVLANSNPSVPVKFVGEMGTTSPNVALPVSIDDYPQSALEQGEQGTVTFDVTIGTTGYVSKCTVVSSSGSAKLDETSCRIATERMRHMPSQDSGGRPAVLTIRKRIQWVLPNAQEIGALAATYFADADYPKEARRRGEEGTVVFQLAIGVEGRVKNCIILDSSGSTTLDETTCRLAAERMRFQPAQGHDGKPVVDAVKGRIRWALP